MRALLHTLRDRRGENRVAATIDAAIECAGIGYSAVLMDISHRGFRMMVDGHLPAGGTITLRIARLPPFEAEAVWVAGLIVGCQFARPLDPGEVEAVLRHAIG